MTTNKFEFANTDEIRNHFQQQYRRRHHPAGRILAGLILIGIGGALFAQKFYGGLPEFLFSWKTALIALGFYIGARRLFYGRKWLIPIFIGGVFLLEDFIPAFSIHNYFWPLFFVFVGMMMVFRPRRKWGHRFAGFNRFGRKRYGPGKYDRYDCAENDRGFTVHASIINDEENNASTANKYNDAEPTPQATSFKDAGEKIHTNVFFGGEKKTIISKNFKGGEITCVFGGAEINLMQADFTGTIEIEINQVFGGTKLLIPSNWKVQSQVSNIMGGFEDKRKESVYTEDPEKVLIIKGENVLAGIEIKSRG